MKEHFVIQLLHRHYTGDLDAKDKDLLMNWLQESPENQDFGSSIKEIWDLSKNYQPKTNFESTTESAFKKFTQNIAKDAPIPETIVAKPTKVAQEATVRRLPYMRWIAGAAACVAIAASGFWVLQNSDTDGNLAVLDTLSDQKEKLALVDNSNIWVNEKSTIQYFKEEDTDVRAIKLEGEAFFQVEKSNRPFVITTENATVTVLGTEFNVESNSETTEVSVKSGRVELRPLNSTQAIELTANQIGIYDAVNKRLYRKQSKSFNGNSWQSGGFSFEDATLEEVFRTLENHYNVDIYTQNSTINSCVFTSPVYQDAEIEEVLKVIELIHNITYERDAKDENRIIIKGGNCH